MAHRNWGRGWENNIWRSERGLFWLFGILMLPISSVMFGWLFWPFNPGGTQLATSWKMCIITTLGLVCNKHASTQGHTFKRAVMNIHTHTHTRTGLSVLKPDITESNFVWCWLTIFQMSDPSLPVPVWVKAIGGGGCFSGHFSLMSNSFAEPDSLWGGCQPH